MARLSEDFLLSFLITEYHSSNLRLYCDTQFYSFVLIFVFELG